MKLNFLIFAMVLGAMGPGRDAPPPEIPETVPEVVEADPPTSPAEMPDAAPATRLELREYDAAEVAPGDFLWIARPVVVFADRPDDPSFRRQMQSLRDQPEALAERDVVVITDTDPAAASAWRRQLHPRGFSLVIMDKDGQVKQRRPEPWGVREITRTIDRFPQRRQEIRSGAVP